MKKKLLFLLSGIFCFALLFSIVPLKNASAESTSVSFSISNNENMTVVSSSHESFSEQQFNNIDTAMETIYSFLSTNNLETFTLNFDNYQLNSGEQINLHGNFTINISGKITASGNSSNLINVNGTEKISITVLPETTFENGKYSIYFETSGNTLNFGTGVHSSSTFFTNYITGNQINVTGNEVLSEEIKIAVRFDTDSKMIVKFGNTSNINRVSLLTDGDFYKLDETQFNMEYYATAYIIYNFDKQGGSFFGDSLKYENYSKQFNLDFKFPTSITKENYQFVGWVGKYICDEKTYYFNSEMLKNYLTSKDLSEFTEDISEINDNYFIGSNSDSEHLLFFIEKNTIPTYSAKWTPVNYTISYNLNGGTNDTNNPTAYNIETENITLADATRTGYTFAGWYSDDSFNNKVTEITKGSTGNKTLYAKWTPVNYTISYNLNGGTNNSNNPSKFTVETPTITLSAPSKTGYNFEGWFTENTFENRVTDILKGSYGNIALYAKWTIKQIQVTYFLLDGDADFNTKTTVSYGGYIQKPSDPHKTGSVFAGWWTSSSGGSEFDFTSPITSTSAISIYARWNAIEYTLKFVLGTEEVTSQIKYGEKINYPNLTPKKGYLFVGWFKDEALTIESDYKTMPDAPEKQLTIYAKWSEKQVISIEDIYQEYEYGDRFASFVDFSDIGNFDVLYYVNNGWQRLAPTEIGSYDVKIIRAEDDTYCYFEKTIKNGYTITPEKLDVVWLIAVFYILTIIEIFVILFIKRMRRMKLSRTFSIVIGTGIISTTQEVNLIISAVFFLVGFIYMIYEIVSTHRTSNNVNFEASQYDNRNRFKKDLIFQNNTEINPNFEYETKNNDSFGDKYSESDIIKMMSYDAFSEERKKKEEAKSKQDISNDKINIIPKIKLEEKEINNEEAFGNKYSNSDILKMMEHDSFAEQRQSLRDSVDIEENNAINFDKNFETDSENIDDEDISENAGDEEISNNNQTENNADIENNLDNENNENE